MKAITKVLLGASLVLVLAGCGDLALRDIIAHDVAGTSGTGTIRVLSVADARVGTGYTLDGIQMTNARSKLLNTKNFGPGGIVTKTITITDTSATITTALLSNYDVLFIGWVPNSPTPPGFSAAELAAMTSWVNAGGVMIVTADDTTHGQVAAQFGEAVFINKSSLGDFMAPSGSGLTHPIFVGPFGTASAVYTSGNVGIMGFSTGALLGYDVGIGNYWTAEESTFGSGKVLFLSDVDFFSNANTSSGTAISGSNGNDVFLGNVFAYEHR